MTTFYLQSDIDEISDNLKDVANSFSGKTILITGSRGFLGRYMVELFSSLNKNQLKEPCKLIELDNLITSGNSETNSAALSNSNFVAHNVIKPYKTKSNIDFIIHAASIASPFYYREYPLETLDVAIHGTRNMLELAKEKRAKILFFSTSEIYGDPDPNNVPTQESYRGNVSCLGPRACYDEGKRVGETLCRIYHNSFGVETVITRPFNIYGPGMNENDFRVLPNFANKIKRGEPLLIYSDGNQTRTFTYITDAITGFMLTLLKGLSGEPYNIGNPNPEISVVDIVKRMEKILDRKLPYHLVEYPDTYPSDEPNRRCPDIRKARSTLKFNPTVDLDEGLRRFLTWTDKAYTGVQL